MDNDTDNKDIPEMDPVEDIEMEPIDDAELDETPPPVDAIVHVTVSGNQMEAHLNVEPPSNDGEPVNMDMLTAALEKSGVNHNIDKKRLDELTQLPLYGEDILIATGDPAENGIDGTISFQFETDTSMLKPKENADGSVDFHDLGIVQNVKQGQVLAIITPPTEGKPGMSVKGKELNQKKGKPVPSYVGKNTELSEDGAQIFAKINGEIAFDGRKISVHETYFIRGDVDNSTGDVKVQSSLDVSGVVLPGFKIEAGNNISVKGTVENAEVRAGGNIELLSGITGSELYCEGDLTCRFIESCNVFVKGEITAEYILNSNIKCGKSIKTVGRRAKIIGGSCLAGHNIVTTTIGSIANVKTKLELGTDHSIIEHQQELMKKVPELKASIEKLRPLLSLLTQLEEHDRLTPEKKEIFHKVKYSYTASMDELAQIEGELERITERLNSRGYGRILCEGTIYPGTTVVIGPTTLHIEERLTNTSLYYSEGNILQGVASK